MASIEHALHSFDRLIFVAESVDSVLSPIAWDEWQGSRQLKETIDSLTNKLCPLILPYRSLAGRENSISQVAEQVVTAFDYLKNLGEELSPTLSSEEIKKIQEETEDIVQSLLVPLFNPPQF